MGIDEWYGAKTIGRKVVFLLLGVLPELRVERFIRDMLIRV
jgi:hypothetical protein